MFPVLIFERVLNQNMPFNFLVMSTYFMIKFRQFIQLPSHIKYLAKKSLVCILGVFDYDSNSL